jgi:hypothetical protein
MSDFYRHIIGAFTAGALWIPLLLWVTTLAGRYTAQTPLISLNWWELALSVTLVVLPALAMSAYQLAPANEHRDPLG